MKIVRVIPLEKGAFKTDLTYFTAKDVENGSIVTIPIRNKKILGLVVFVEDVSNTKGDIKDMSFKLKKIDEIKNRSIFRPEFLESTLELSSYFVSRKNNAVIFLIPSIFREKYDEIEKFSPLENSTLEVEEKSNIFKKIKTEKLLFQASFEDRISYYKTLIRGQFALKKSVFIVLPTQRDIKNFEQVLSKGIEKFTFSIHGGLKPKKVIEKYKQIVNETHGVLILSTSQFLSIPRKDIGIIIVEHESSNAYKMISKPHFDLRIFAEIFASKINARFILADTLLRFETIARVEIDGLSEIHPISFRTSFEKTIIEIINPNEERGERKSFRIFGYDSIGEIENSLKNKKNVFIFSLRKGLATFTVCKDCGENVNCEKCNAPVVLYLSRDGKKRMFICNRCNTEKDPKTLCNNCGSWNLIPLGIGTDTVYEELKNKFSKTKIFKLDKDVAKSASGAEKIIQEFEENPGSILIATEMAFFYLEEKVDLSIIASFDSLWTIPNYKMSEKIIQLLLFIILKTEKKVIIQTKNESDTALSSIKSENLLPFVRSELEDRKKLNYPPYKRFIKIVFLGDKTESIEAKEILNKMFKDYSLEIFSGFMSKNKDQYITNALIKIEPKNWSLPALSIGSSFDQNLKNLLFSLPETYEVSVDPEDLL